MGTSREKTARSRFVPIAALLLCVAACGPAGGGPADSGTGDPNDAVTDQADTGSDGSSDSGGWDWGLPDTQPDPETEPPLGICGVACMGESLTCPDGAFCEYGVIDFLEFCTESGCGFCAWVPDTCEPEDLPACGCDGVLYENPCERRRARVGPDLSGLSCLEPEPEPEAVEPAPETVEPGPDAATD